MNAPAQPLRASTVAGIVLLLLGVAGGAVLFLALGARLGTDISQARAFDHAVTCPGAPTTPPSCLEPVNGYITGAYVTHGSRSGTYYHVTLALADGSEVRSESVSYGFYYAIRIGDPVAIYRWGRMLAFVMDRGLYEETDDTPTAAAGTTAAGMLLGLALVVMCVGSIPLTYRRGRRRGIVADLGGGSVTYVPAPTTASWLARSAWGFFAAAGCVFWALIGDTTAPLILASGSLGSAFIITYLSSRSTLTFSRDGIVYRSGSGRSVIQAPWAEVLGIRIFGAGRSRYSAIALANGQRIRYANFTFMTAENTSLTYTVTANARRGVAPVYAPATASAALIL